MFVTRRPFPIPCLVFNPWSVCLLVRNLGECFVSLLVEPIAGKNVSPSDKQLWRFLKNVSVVEKS